MSAKRTFFYRKSFAEMRNYSIWTRSYRRSSIRRHKRVNLWEGCFRATLFCWLVADSEGGRGAGNIGGAVCNCLIGCALAFRHCEAWHKPWQSPFSSNYSLLTFSISSAQYGWLRRCVRQSGHAGLAQSPSISRAKRKQTYYHQHEYAPR